MVFSQVLDLALFVDELALAVIELLLGNDPVVINFFAFLLVLREKALLIFDGFL